MLTLLLALQVTTLSAQTTANTVYDRVILGGHVMDPASKLDAVRNIGLLDGRIAVITTQAVRGRDTGLAGNNDPRTTNQKSRRETF